MKASCSHCGNAYEFAAADIPVAGYHAQCTRCNNVFFISPEVAPTALAPGQVGIRCQFCRTLYQFAPEQVPAEGYEAECTQCRGVFWVSPETTFSGNEEPASAPAPDAVEADEATATAAGPTGTTAGDLFGAGAVAKASSVVGFSPQSLSQGTFGSMRTDPNIMMPNMSDAAAAMAPGSVEARAEPAPVSAAASAVVPLATVAPAPAPVAVVPAPVAAAAAPAPVASRAQANEGPQPGVSAALPAAVPAVRPVAAPAAQPRRSGEVETISPVQENSSVAADGPLLAAGSKRRRWLLAAGLGLAGVGVAAAAQRWHAQGTAPAAPLAGRAAMASEGIMSALRDDTQAGYNSACAQLQAAQAAAPAADTLALWLIARTFHGLDLQAEGAALHTTWEQEQAQMRGLRLAVRENGSLDDVQTQHLSALEARADTQAGLAKARLEAAGQLLSAAQTAGQEARAQYPASPSVAVAAALVYSREARDVATARSMLGPDMGPQPSVWRLVLEGRLLALDLAQQDKASAAFADAMLADPKLVRALWEQLRLAQRADDGPRVDALAAAILVLSPEHDKVRALHLDPHPGQAEAAAPPVPSAGGADAAGAIPPPDSLTGGGDGAEPAAPPPHRHRRRRRRPVEAPVDEPGAAQGDVAGPPGAPTGGQGGREGGAVDGPGDRPAVGQGLSVDPPPAAEARPLGGPPPSAATAPPAPPDSPSDDGDAPSAEVIYP